MRSVHLRCLLSLVALGAAVLVASSYAPWQGHIRDIVQGKAPSGIKWSDIYVSEPALGQRALAAWGRVTLDTVVRAGPFGECDVIANLKAGQFVCLRPSALPGWSRLLLVDGGHGYVKNAALQSSNFVITSDSKYAPAPERTVDNPISADGPRLTQPFSSPRIPISTGGVYVGSSTGHWISEVSSNGKYVELEDGSLWEVDPVDAIVSSLWLPTEDIVVVESRDAVYPYRLVNKDQGETVKARLIKNR
jgi:hypothetical protein